MPAAYAHYTFGRRVLEELNIELRENINNNIELFHIGLHGPDILFYYKPLKSNEINKLGHEIHRISADSFFERARAIISVSGDERASAYVAGFICHYMLDSQCHPYIRTREDKISHNEIETEFDRAVMLKDSLNPITFKPTGHIVPSIENARCISRFFPEAAPEEILKSLGSMKFYLNLLVAPGKVQRALLTTALKITGSNDKIDLIKKYSPNEECLEINDVLMRLYNEGIKPAARVIEEYFNSLPPGGKEIFPGAKLNERFNRNFG